MKDESKTSVKSIVQEFVSEKITEKKLSMDGENYLQWQNCRDSYERTGQEEDPLEQMTNE